MPQLNKSKDGSVKRVVVAIFNVAWPSSRRATHEIGDWLRTEEGKFILEHTLSPLDTVTQDDFSSSCTKHLLVAKLTDESEFFWRLKFK